MDPHEEVVQLAQAIEAAGATIINTGIGWHEARYPNNRNIRSTRGIRLGNEKIDG